MGWPMGLTVLEESAQRHNEQFRSAIQIIKSSFIDISMKSMFFIEVICTPMVWCVLLYFLGQQRLIDAVI